MNSGYQNLTFAQNETSMNNWILILSLAVALSSLGAFFILYVQYRKMKREKDRSIAEALRKQDRLANELELTRTEKKTLERVLSTITPRSPEGEGEYNSL